MLTIPLAKLAFIIEKAREFDEESPATFEESGRPPEDESVSDILLDRPANPTEQELYGAINGLNTDEQEELLALLWVGRGDFTRDSWREAMTLAQQTRTSSEADYLIGTPLMADYLEEALSQLGISLEESDESVRP